MTISCDCSAWNLRFAAYAAHHGRGPDEMLVADREAYPGGCMAGFTVWISQRWREWATEKGFRSVDDARAMGDRRDLEFDAWLVCWLASDQKAALQAHAAESGRSESALLCAGLVALGVLAERGTNPANRDTETTPEPG